MTTTNVLLRLLLVKLGVLLVALASQQSVYQVNPLVVGYPSATSTGIQFASSSIQGSPEWIKVYIEDQARAKGVNPRVASYIAYRESQYNPRAIGDSGKSVGLWQFNLKANPEISRVCARDYKCSTDLALQWILDGKVMAWSTYANCRNWYQDCPF